MANQVQQNRYFISLHWPLKIVHEYRKYSTFNANQLNTRHKQIFGKKTWWQSGLNWYKKLHRSIVWILNFLKSWIIYVNYNFWGIKMMSVEVWISRLMTLVSGFCNVFQFKFNVHSKRGGSLLQIHFEYQIIWVQINDLISSISRPDTWLCNCIHNCIISFVEWWCLFS